VQLQNATQAAESDSNIDDVYADRSFDVEDFAAAIRSTIDAIPTPVVNVTVPDAKARKVERDRHGNITRIVEE
jgi:hypothetical protein